MLDFYNSFSGIHVRQVNYKRHWFSSDTTIQMDITHPNYFSAFNQLGVDELKIPHHYTMDVHIQHGPFIYTKNKAIPSYLGIAAIYNVLHETPDIKTFFSQLGASNHFVQENDGFISLAGNYFHHLVLSGIHFVYPDNAYFKMDKINGYIWFMPSNSHISGALSIQSIGAESGGDSIALPDFSYQFDISPNEYNIWSGTSSLQLSEVQVLIEGINIKLSHVDYHSNANIVNTQLSSDRQLKIDKLFFNDKKFGSIYLKAGVNHINAEALANIFSVYHEITTQGEMYQSQLREKIESLLPTLVHSGSMIQLEKCDVDTTIGRLHMDGKLRWSMNEESIPDEFPAVLTAADGQLNMKLSKAFADELIDFYVTSPLINGEGFDLDEDDIADATDNIYYNMQNNTLLLDFLVNNGQLRETDALALLELQKKMVDIKDYANKIKMILDDKYLTLVTSYFLFWGYTGVADSVHALEQMVTDSQKEAKKEIHAQINEWLEQGYLTATQDDYLISIKQDQGNILFNGKSLSN